MTSKELAFACAKAADDAKATAIAVYDLRGTSSITDFAIVCTATSVPHLRAVLRDVDKEIGEQYGLEPIYAERTPNALWSVLDYIDVMVHVMADEVRDFYNLEEFWKPENRIEWAPES
ncbi:MAG: ribosome silencing factor [Akkermansia sp.]|nr:ribosome silencing factor [Akkermansia sp.]